MNDFAHRITASLPKTSESWFPNVLFAYLEATQIIKYTISEKGIQWRPTRHMF